MLYKLQKPALPKDSRKEFFKLLVKQEAEIFEFARKVSDREYLYWDTFKHKEPTPKGVSKEMLWMVTKFIRNAQSIKTPVKDKNGELFTWSKLKFFEEFFHEVDMNTGGGLYAGSSEIKKVNRQKLISRGIMEEAIASSQLEGAATSRQAAKKMLREGRKPRNKSEQMIVNAYLSMKQVEETYIDAKLSLDIVKEMHSLITNETLDSEGKQPKLRTTGDPIVVSDESTGAIYHTGPEVPFVEKEMERLILFANDELENPEFIHPIIKAIVLHFWIGYLHPFTDGNGRLARLIFYWYLIKNGYWAFAYLPISKAIKRSPKKYIMAYVYTEQDDNDLTYFINYNIQKIQLAIREFKEYIEQQSLVNIKMRKKFKEIYEFNDRQIHLLQYMYGDSDASTNLTAHMNVYQISKMTANTDLKKLVSIGLLHPKKQGRNVHYFGTDKIKSLFTTTQE